MEVDILKTILAKNGPMRPKALIDALELCLPSRKEAMLLVQVQLDKGTLALLDDMSIGVSEEQGVEW